MLLALLVLDHAYILKGITEMKSLRDVLFVHAVYLVWELAFSQLR